MVDPQELKNIFFFKHLPEEILSRIAPLAQVELFGEETVLFKQGESLDNLYGLLEGMVFLNSRSASNRVLTLDEVTPGRCFGLSSLADEGYSSFTAICAEECRIITVSNRELTDLCEQDKRFGYAVMVQLVHLFKSRRDKHTRQFMQSIASHPDVVSMSS